MKEKTNTRTKWLTVRLSEEEEKKLLQFYRKTTAQGLSEYARDMLLKEPVTVLYRNASADAFLNEMIGLKNELTVIGNNISQLVLRLHQLDQFPQLKAWVILNEAHQKALLQTTDAILEKVVQIYTLWLQK